MMSAFIQLRGAKMPLSGRVAIIALPHSTSRIALRSPHAPSATGPGAVDFEMGDASSGKAGLKLLKMRDFRA
jgi:hypothetical protein